MEADENVSEKYTALMDRRIAYAMECRLQLGAVPYADELDELFPIPETPSQGTAKGWGYHARVSARDRAYGVCGISRHRLRWVARLDRKGRTICRYFGRAVDAAKWFNRMESRFSGRNAVLCSVAAAELLDDRIIEWNHVIMCRKGEDSMRWELQQKVEDRAKWLARTITN